MQGLAFSVIVSILTTAYGGRTQQPQAHGYVTALVITSIFMTLVECLTIQNTIVSPLVDM